MLERENSFDRMCSLLSFIIRIASASVHTTQHHKLSSYIHPCDHQKACNEPEVQDHSLGTSFIAIFSRLQTANPPKFSFVTFQD